MRARSGAQRLAVTNPGTIPDRGLFGVFLPDGARVGELDEEMVYESRPGETFLLGATTWRIEEITHERVVVTPAPGQPGKMPFWHGDGPGRPLELGRALGAFVRELRGLSTADAVERLRTVHALDARAAANLVAYLDEQGEATGAVPDDRTIVVERFRDEIGDWRVCILSPFGVQVHAPWGMAIKARLAERWGVQVEMIWSDDGIAIRLPEALDDVGLSTDALAIDPDRAYDIVVAELPHTALFASRFREAAARALLLPRRRPDQRTPLWQQRQRSADLLAVAGRHPTFPILLEATRECVNDVFDLPALREVLGDIRSRQVRVVEVETTHASPFAQSLLFGWVGVYMYEGDAPLAERRAAALALDRDLLDDLLGADELRELLDAGALADLELELQSLADGRRARDVDEAHDLLRRLGPLSLDELAARCEGGDAAAWAGELVGQRRAFRAVIAGDERVCAADDAGRLRDALGVELPVGLPEVFAQPVDAPLVDLVGRFARTHGPFVTAEVATRYGVPTDRTAAALGVLDADGRVVLGEFRPDGIEREWCDVDVLRQLRRRSLARASPRGRARRRGHAGSLPRRVARPRRTTAGRRGAGRRARPAPGRAAAGIRAGGRDPARPPGRVPPGRPRRAVRGRRGGVARCRRHRRERRACPPGVPRPGRPAGTRGGRRRSRPARRPRARRAAGPPRWAWRVVLGRPRPGRPARRRAV